MTAKVLPMRRAGGSSEAPEFELDDRLLRMANAVLAGERVNPFDLARLAKSFAERHRSLPPPHDLDCEAAVLSACLLESEAAARVLDVLRAEHFYSDANRRIYEAMEALNLEGSPIDIALVASWLRSRELLAHIGGASYLAQLADATPSVHNVLAHAQRIYALWRRRCMIATGQTIAAEGYGDPSAPLVDARQPATENPEQAWLELCAVRVEAIATNVATGPLVTTADAVDQAEKQIQRVEARQGQVLGYTTGVPALDVALGGLMPSDVTLIGARKVTGGETTTTSAGKSSFGAFVATHLAYEGYRKITEGPEGTFEQQERIGIAIFGLEMTAEQYKWRMTCQAARIDADVFRSGGYVDRTTGKLFPDIAARIIEHAAWIANLPIVFECESGLTPTRLRARVLAVREAFAKQGARLGLVVIDSIGLMSPDRPSRDGNREKELNQIGRAIRRLSTDTKIPGIHYMVITQIQKDGTPKDCKSLADHAVNEIVVHLEDDPNEATIPGHFHIRKQRDGRHGVRVPLWFFKKYGAFKENV